jgi:hypothetical protein
MPERFLDRIDKAEAKYLGRLRLETEIETALLERSASDAAL